MFVALVSRPPDWAGGGFLSHPGKTLKANPNFTSPEKLRKHFPFSNDGTASDDSFSF